MRKFYFFVLVISIACSASAQIKKGSILLGGQLYYSNSKTQSENINQKSENGTIGVSLGKAFRENSVVGFNFSFSPTRQTALFSGSDTFDVTYNRFNIGAFFRKYKQLGKDFYFFGQVDGAYITSNQKHDYVAAGGNVKSTQRGGFVALTPGISYQIFKKMHLELTLPNILSLQYLVTKVDSEIQQANDYKTEEFSFYSNLNNNTGLGWLGVGFRFIL